ncbi:putative actin patch protein [Rosellinia necatrix]|uniref:Putative actin patch protein n=1 Tax=Rosellinia necatrix TaxID=77044 RepID=A0A1W2TKY4_ROSNE|nr:putative actin patch protein [Rosellinia necatrix]
MTSMPGLGVGGGSYGADAGRERGARRRKLAAMAGSVYRAGAVAVNEIKESYNQTRSSEMDSPEISRITIPGSFPDVAIITTGNEQMVLFPSYAKRHVREQPRQLARPGEPPPPSGLGVNEQERWRQEWDRNEDEKAVVDVDVRGWIYNPHRGPMTRRNRVLIGLARQLSGIPAPRQQQPSNGANPDPPIAGAHQQHEYERERESIAREAREIERRGRAEEAAAQQGDYSEKPHDAFSEDEGDRPGQHRPSRSSTPHRRPTSPVLPTRTNTSGSSVFSDAELAAANANLMARIGPFMTTPLVELPITLFFYNDIQSQSRIVRTDDSGHFVIRAALDFIPTHVRVLANEDISYTETVQLIEPRGISLISDIDDTIKRSNIALGAKEIFRNTFVRELKDLTIDGVTDWYTSIHNMGVRIHYCSNSPWQLYPVLATYFKLASLPPGSLHLKRYTGMLQGIFEPVAERKKGTLEKIMSDFPERKFLLVGDSGEADLEVYTELAIANPGRIKGIFIRDVTTPERPGYFDAAYDFRGGYSASGAAPNRWDQKSGGSSMDSLTDRPALPPRNTAASKSQDFSVGDLIDLSDDPKPPCRTESGFIMPNTGQTPQHGARNTYPQGRKPPPKPAKPSALKSTATAPIMPTKETDPNRRKTSPVPPPPRRSFPGSEPSGKPPSLHPLSQAHNSSEQTLTIPSDNSARPVEYAKTNSTTPTPPPRRRGTPSSVTGLSPHLMPSRRRTGNSDIDFDPLGSSAIRRSNTDSPVTTTQSSASGSPNQEPLNKKLELWRRRLERAEDILSQHGVPLYTWRRGEDVVTEAIGIVRQTLEEMGIRKRGP